MRNNPFPRATAAANDLAFDVDEEAEKLVKQGIPLWTAIAQAQANVRRRRQFTNRGVVFCV